MYNQINFQFLSVKRIVSFLAVFLIISGTLLGQGVTQAFKYQAVLRTPSGDVIQSSPVEIKISILLGTGGNIGLPIYQELHEVTTNKFGLVNLNVGSGHVLIGDFASILWERTDHFLGIEISVNGGSFIDVGGFTQLLSVPYAIVAQRSVEGDADADPTNELNAAVKLIGTTLNVYDAGGTMSTDLSSLEESAEVTAEAAARIEADVALQTDLANEAAARMAADAALQSNIDPEETARIDGDAANATNIATNATAIATHNAEDEDTNPENEIELPLKPQDGTIAFYNTGAWQVLTPGTEGQVLTLSIGLPVWADPSIPIPLAIGDLHAGGIIFYLAGPNEDLNGDGVPDQGLVSASGDQSTGAEWGYYGTEIPYLTNVTNYPPPSGAGAEVGDGVSNTTLIVSNCGEAGIAARICDDLDLASFGDWFLPSARELNLMYENIGQGNSLGLGNVGGFAANWYWSSTEYDYTNAWLQTFFNGYQNYYDKVSNLHVRAVRVF